MNQRKKQKPEENKTIFCPQAFGCPVPHSLLSFYSFRAKFLQLHKSHHSCPSFLFVTNVTLSSS